MIDYISREKAMHIVTNAVEDLLDDDLIWGAIRDAACAYIHDRIRNVKAADVESVRHVVPIYCGIAEYYGGWVQCPNCGFDNNTSVAKFCGGCGAKMDLEGEILNPERSGKEGNSDGI